MLTIRVCVAWVVNFCKWSHCVRTTESLLSLSGELGGGDLRMFFLMKLSPTHSNRLPTTADHRESLATKSGRRIFWHLKKRTLKRLKNGDYANNVL